MAEVDHSKRIELKTFPNIRVMVYKSSEIEDLWVIKVMAKVTCVETGEPIEVGTDMQIVLAEPPTKDELAGMILDLLLDHVTHEVHEGLWIDGKRAFPPPHARTG